MNRPIQLSELPSEHLLSRIPSNPTPDEAYQQANLYLTGSKEYPKSLSKAMSWFHFAARKGHTPSQLVLGQIFTSNTSNPQNGIIGTAWLKKAALCGDSQAMLLLGDALAKGVGSRPDVQGALIWYKKAAKAKNTLAHHRIAQYFDSLGDFETAKKHYELAVSENSIESLYSLAKLIYPTDTQRAVSLLSTCVNIHNHKPACFLLGAHFKSLGQHEKARKVWESGLPYTDSQYALGHDIIHSKISSQYSRAVTLLKSAAKKKNALACIDLAHCYHHGYGVKQDPECTGIYLECAARLGHIPAYFPLSVFLWKEFQTSKSRDTLISSRSWMLLFIKHARHDEDPSDYFTWLDFFSFPVSLGLPKEPLELAEYWLDQYHSLLGPSFRKDPLELGHTYDPSPIKYVDQQTQTLYQLINFDTTLQISLCNNTNDLFHVLKNISPSSAETVNTTQSTHSS